MSVPEICVCFPSGDLLRLDQNLSFQHSYVLNSLLSHPCSLEANTRTIEVTEFSKEIFQNFNTFIHQQPVQFKNNAEAERVYQFSQFYEVKGLEKEAERYITENLSMDQVEKNYCDTSKTLIRSLYSHPLVNKASRLDQKDIVDRLNEADKELSYLYLQGLFLQAIRSSKTPDAIQLSDFLEEGIDIVETAISVEEVLTDQEKEKMWGLFPDAFKKAFKNLSKIDTQTLTEDCEAKPLKNFILGLEFYPFIQIKEMTKLYDFIIRLSHYRNTQIKLRDFAIRNGKEKIVQELDQIFESVTIRNEKEKTNFSELVNTATSQFLSLVRKTHLVALGIIAAITFILGLCLQCPLARLLSITSFVTLLAGVTTLIPVIGMHGFIARLFNPS